MTFSDPKEKVQDFLMESYKLLKNDELEKAISILLEMISFIDSNVIPNLDINLYDSKISLTLYAAAINRAKKAYNKGLIDYDKHSQERAKIISAILETFKDSLEIYVSKEINYDYEQKTIQFWKGINHLKISSLVKDLSENLEKSSI